MLEPCILVLQLGQADISRIGAADGDLQLALVLLPGEKSAVTTEAVTTEAVTTVERVRQPRVRRDDLRRPAELTEGQAGSEKSQSRA